MCASEPSGIRHELVSVSRRPSWRWPSSRPSCSLLDRGLRQRPRVCDAQPAALAVEREEADGLGEVAQLGVAVVARVEVGRLLDDEVAHRAQARPPALTGGRVDGGAEEVDEASVLAQLALGPPPGGRCSAVAWGLARKISV